MPVSVWDRVKVDLEKTKILDGRRFPGKLMTEQLTKVQYSKEDDEDLKYDNQHATHLTAQRGCSTRFGCFTRFGFTLSGRRGSPGQSPGPAH